MKTVIAAQHQRPIRRAYERLTGSGAAPEKAVSIIAINSPYSVAAVRKFVGLRGEYVVSSTVARTTGTRVLLVDRGPGSDDDRWETICEDHGGVCSHGTRALAEAFTSHPEEWCEDCMHGPGTLAGTAPIPNTPA